MNREMLKTIVAQQLKEFSEPGLNIVPRNVGPNFNYHLDASEISVITGVRRCGKSVLMKQISRLVKDEYAVYFLDLEDPLLEDFSIADFQVVYEIWQELLPKKHARIAVFYDEIQNVPKWERWVRKLSQRPDHKVFITGSNSQMLSSELASTLTGRHLDLQLAPFSLKEISDYELNGKQLSKLEQYAESNVIRQNQSVDRFLKFGGFPRCYQEQHTELLALYFNDIITRDIIKRRKVKHGAALIKLGRLLCRQNTRLLNKSKTAALLGLKDISTLNKYCSYFEETFLFKELRKYSESLRKQMRSLSKFYCIDPALPRAVAGSPSEGYSFEFENLVLLEVLKNFPKMEVAYWTSANGLEVDFIFTHKNKSVAIQAAYSVASSNTLDREYRALVEAHRELGLTELLIVTFSENDEIKAKDHTVKIISVARLFDCQAFF